LAIKRALADALAEWEDVCPRKKAQRRAQERAVAQKETEDKIAQAEGLAAKNQELIAENQQLTTQLQAAEAKVTHLERRVAQLRELWKDAQRRQQIAEANLASIEGGAGSSSGPAPGELQEAQQAVADATIEVQKLREQLARQVAKRDEAEDDLKQSQAQLAATQQDLQAIMRSQTELEADLVAERQQRNEAQRALRATAAELGRRSAQAAALMPAPNPSLAPAEPEGGSSPMGHVSAVSAADEDKHDEDAAAAQEPAPEGTAQ
jgi:DNA repair exonuclease SbcCD ATPase subunit